MWPQLHVPLWAYQHVDRVGQIDETATEVGEEEEEEEEAEEKRHSEHDHTESKEDEPSQRTDDWLQPASKWQKTDSIASRHAPAGNKDWALECYHLYQHLHFTTLALMHRALNSTSWGARLVYHLPFMVRPARRKGSSGEVGAVQRGRVKQRRDGCCWGAVAF